MIMGRDPDKETAIGREVSIINRASATAWVRACAKLIEEEGPQQFLVNLLYVLRECFQEESTE